MSEIALEQFAQIDFQLKARAKQFWAFLATLQEIRSGVRARARPIVAPEPRAVARACACAVPVSLTLPNSALPQWPTLTLSARPPEREDKRSFLKKLAEFIHPGPDSRDELIETLADAEDNDVIGAESRVMLEGVLRMADMTAGDVMVAAPRMDLVNIDAPVRRRCCTS